MEQTELKIQVLLAEYERVKEEIFHHKSTQQTILNFIIILAAIEIPLLTGDSLLSLNTQSSINMWILLVLPIPFTLLAFYHSAYTIRIHKLASFLDGESKDKLEAIVGKDTLRSVSYRPTSNIFSIPRSTQDGRMVYIALLGLKMLPQLLPLTIYLMVKTSTWSVLEIGWFLVVFLLMIISAAGQHD